MSTFTTHTIESAPQAAQATLQGAQKSLGFIPNLYANMAESPAVLNAYTTLAGNFEKSSFSPTEQQVVLITASVVNNCEFCVAAHSVIAKQMQKIDADVVNAIRDGNAIADAKLEALATFTKAVVNDRGFVTGQPVDEFLASGFTKAQALEVVLGVTMKTLSNYANHLTETAVNEQFESEAWSRS
jgi:AhpD family alkylhydroperoxidase